MNNDLYFIPIIARALQEERSAPALCRAFEQITKLGQTAEYANGYANFERFMCEVARHWLTDDMAAVETDTLCTLIAELETGTFEGTDQERQAAIEMIHSVVRRHDEFTELHAALEEDAKRTPRLLVLAGDTVLAVVDSGKTRGPWTIRDVLPGHYSVALDTGRVIWEGCLEARDLLWTEAFPGEPLDLAADTGVAGPRKTREERLLAGEVVLRVIPGLERGRIVLEVHPGEED